LEAIAEKSLERKTGARGLRAIMEQAMLDLMYTVPSDEMIESCIVTKEMIEGTGEPKLSYRDELPTTKKSRKKSSRTVGETA
jgi:ATP-dependent Clp protease ATP-binding subunit ClpX